MWTAIGVVWMVLGPLMLVLARLALVLRLRRLHWHGPECRCMTCHAVSGAAVTQPDGSHERYAGMTTEARQAAIDQCNALVAYRSERSTN